MILVSLIIFIKPYSSLYLVIFLKQLGSKLEANVLAIFASGFIRKGSIGLAQSSKMAKKVKFSTFLEMVTKECCFHLIVQLCRSIQMVLEIMLPTSFLLFLGIEMHCLIHFGITRNILWGTKSIGLDILFFWLNKKLPM